MISRVFVIVSLLSCFALTVAITLAFLLSSATIRESPTSWICVGSLASMPDDGLPHRFPLVVEKRDAWTTMPEHVLGHVFVLREQRSNRLIVLPEVTRFGARIQFDQEDQVFRERCWGTKYAATGKCLNTPPHPGDIQQLETKTTESSVFVKLPRHQRSS